MSNSTRSTLAVAVTVTPAADADAVFGPQVVAVGVVHIHTGSPTRPIDAGSSDSARGAMPRAIAVKRMESTAC
jgi:hypothetical protein